MLDALELHIQTSSWRHLKEAETLEGHLVGTRRPSGVHLAEMVFKTSRVYLTQIRLGGTTRSRFISEALDLRPALILEALLDPDSSRRQ